MTKDGVDISAKLDAALACADGIKRNPYRELQKNAEEILKDLGYPKLSDVGKAEIKKKIEMYREAADRYDRQDK